MKYTEIRKINVSDHIEKKNGLSYLSWAWAVDQLFQLDETANWSYGESKVFGETMMVFCTVTAFGRERTAQLPVMNHRNQAIPNPDAFQVNTAMQRCLAKAISLHGIGLYIYAGEDLPEQDKEERKLVTREYETLEIMMASCETAEQLQEVWKGLSSDERILMNDLKNELKEKL